MLRVCWWFGSTSHQFWCYQTSKPWRWGRSFFPKIRKTFTSWRGCLPEKIFNELCRRESFKIYIQELTVILEKCTAAIDFLTSCAKKKTYGSKSLIVNIFKTLPTSIVKLLNAYTGSSKKMDGILNRYNLKCTGRIYTFGVLKCSEKFKVLDLL